MTNSLFNGSRSDSSLREKKILNRSDPDPTLKSEFNIQLKQNYVLNIHYV